MTRLKTNFICCLLTLPATACGLKGPLYLPGDSAGPPPAVEAGESEQDDDGREGEEEGGRGSHS